jgi:hypothetical protein
VNVVKNPIDTITQPDPTTARGEPEISLSARADARSLI